MFSSYTNITFPNAAATYDAITGRLAALAHGPSLARFVDFAYGYDGVGNITAVNDNLDAAQDRTFTYDTLRRLTAGGTATAPETYGYDIEGNRTSSHLSAAHTVNDVNRLTQDDTYDYTYDLNGNLASKTDRATSDLTTYDYDALDRLVRITFPNLTTATYRYGALGRRIEKDVGGTVTKYVYDGTDIVLEYDGTDTLLARFSHGDGTDQPLAQERGGASYFYHADHQGSVVALTDAVGTVVNDYAYDAYGRIVSSVEGIANPYTYTGRELDAESGLYYYRARYYDADTGRFISEDPIGFAGGDANLYAYVFNNPVNLVDPLGLEVFVTTKTGRTGPVHKPNQLDRRTQAIEKRGHELGLKMSKPFVDALAPFVTRENLMCTIGTITCGLTIGSLDGPLLMLDAVCSAVFSLGCTADSPKPIKNPLAGAPEGAPLGRSPRIPRFAAPPPPSCGPSFPEGGS